MAWKETHVEEERMKFIAACLSETAAWTMTELCEAFSVSRKTGYKWLRRYRASGLEGLRDQSRAPIHHPNAVAPAIMRRLVAERRRYRCWGPRKIVAVLRREEPQVDWPAVSTVGEILKRQGLVRRRRRRRRGVVVAAPLTRVVPAAPNELWCADYKGWFRLGDGRRCDPLTITDAYSRFLLRCRAVPRLDERGARPIFESAFREYGLPTALRTDNGTPFASAGLGGLTRLAVWWVKLGIRLERIEPGKPQQNGRHERMHATLKQETACPPRGNASAQQRAFERFRQRYNFERPHEALDDRVPGQSYWASPRRYPRRVPEVEYPAHFEIRTVRTSGEIKWRGELRYVSEALVGEPVGLEPTGTRHWRLYFGSVLLALLDDATGTLLPYRRPQRAARVPRGLL